MSLKQTFLNTRKKIYNFTVNLGLYRYNLGVYNHKFFEDNQDEGKKHSKWFVDLLLKIFNFRSIADVGCGTAHFLKTCLDKGITDIYGIEGSEDAFGNLLMVDKKFVLKHDLRDPLKTDHRYDICISIEVAEHIDKKYSENYIKILTDLSNIVILTAAPPNQGGTAHVNEQPQEWWIDKFAKFGYKINNQKVLELQRGMGEAKSSGFFVAGWFIPNIMVFEKA